MTNAERNQLAMSVHNFVKRVADSLAKQYPGISTDDSIQDGMLFLVKSLERYDPSKGALTTYAHHQVFHRMRDAAFDARNHIRIPREALSRKFKGAAEKARFVRHLNTEAIARLKSYRNDHSCEDREYLTKKLSRLTPKQFEVIKLHFYEGLDYTEIGARLGMTRQGVRLRVRTALKNLKRLIEKDYA